MNIERQVIAILAEQALLEPTDIAMSSTLTDLGIDSLGLVETLFSIEETFDISVPFNANSGPKSEFDVTTVASIVAGIRRLKDNQTA